jgi:hypothetical protein
MQRQHAGPPASTVFCGVFLTYLPIFLYQHFSQEELHRQRGNRFGRRSCQNITPPIQLCARFCRARSLFGSYSSHTMQRIQEGTEMCVSLWHPLCGWLLYIGLITFDFDFALLPRDVLLAVRPKFNLPPPRYIWRQVPGWNQ